MSIKLSDGVILPDIPKELLDEYPYAVINYGGVLKPDNSYFLLLSKNPMCFFLKSYFSNMISNLILPYPVTTRDDCYSATYEPSSTEFIWKPWTYNDGSFCRHCCVSLIYPYEISWTNHDIYVGESTGDRRVGIDESPETMNTILLKGDYIQFYASGYTPENTTDKNKFLGVAGLERLIENTRSLIDTILPSDGTTGQVLTIGENGKPIWANYTGNTSLSIVEEVES